MVTDLTRQFYKDHWTGGTCGFSLRGRQGGTVWGAKSSGLSRALGCTHKSTINMCQPLHLWTPGFEGLVSFTEDKFQKSCKSYLTPQPSDPWHGMSFACLSTYTWAAGPRTHTLVFVEITVSYCPSEVLLFTMKSLHFSFPASLGREKLFIQG